MHEWKPSPLPFFCSSQLVRQFSLVVESLVLPMFDLGHDIACGHPIPCGLVGDDGTWGVAEPAR